MRTNLLLVSVTATALGLLAGCKVTGGGWLDSAVDPAKKATFAVTAECKNGASVARGQFQYHDHGGPWGPNALTVAAHGVINAPFEGVCIQPPVFPIGVFTGTYEPQPKKLGSGGTFTISVEDGGEPGPSNGDTFFVEFVGGVFDGYSNSGNINGGNIQVHE